MSAHGFAAAVAKMRGADVGGYAVSAFESYYRQLEAGATGIVVEADIDPLESPERAADLELDEEAQRSALARTAVVKLNGGLGTSMGLHRAKSLLPVRAGRTFLDVIVSQVSSARERYGCRLPVVFMDSFRTRADTLRALAAYPDLPVGDLPLDFLQSQEPKLLVDDLTPVEWPADPELEWCPPGHGDVYGSLAFSGTLQALLDAGFRYAFLSNADNLGATADPRVAGWFAASGAPFASEVCRRTPADRKGGHLAVRRSDGRLILRETAQTTPEDLEAMTDIGRHRYFNTNNLWVDLAVLQTVLAERDGVLGLPMIRNEKHVDAGDPTSPEVVQVETAMGAAVEVFDGARAIEVGRERFLPVKTTNDLLVVRSDTYCQDDAGRLQLAAGLTDAPLVDLEPAYYKLLGEFDRRFAAGPPSLRAARSLTVHGDWTFESDVTVLGDVELPADGAPGVIASGSVLGADTVVPSGDE